MGVTTVHGSRGLLRLGRSSLGRHSRARSWELGLRKRISDILLFTRHACGSKLGPQGRLARQLQRLLAVKQALRMLELKRVKLAQLFEQRSFESVRRRRRLLARRPPTTAWPYAGGVGRVLHY
eukprot:scaffold5190_cov113-Isochrysis_galbana.AAC.4